MTPRALYQRDPTVDYSVHEAVLHTMATCHSLRRVGNELLGDPLDLKMFEFTGWSFEESGYQSTEDEEGEYRNTPYSSATPPMPKELGIGSRHSSAEVYPLINSIFKYSC